jgi:hypothetical protein
LPCRKAKAAFVGSSEPQALLINTLLISLLFKNTRKTSKVLDEHLLPAA